MHARRKPRHEPADISAGDTDAREGEALGQSVAKVELVRGKRIIDLARIEIGQVPVKFMDAGDGRHSFRLSCDTAAIVIGSSAVNALSGLHMNPNSKWVETDAPDAEWWAVAVGGASGYLRRQIITKA